MRYLACGVGLLLLTCSGCERIESGYCRMRLPAASVEVTTEPLQVVLDHQRLARALGDAHSGDGEHITYGLTSAVPVSRSQLTLHVARLPGAVCATAAVHVDLAYRDLHVEVARELAPESCSYQTVLGHEMKHVAAYRAALKDSAQTLAQETRLRLSLQRAKVYTSTQALDDQMREFEDDWLAPRAKGLLDAVRDAQGAVDTAAEYARVATACPGEPVLSGAKQP